MRAALLSLLVAAPVFAMGPFEKNHPLVDEGTTAYENGEYERALEKFDAAGKDRPADARVQYNRGLALHKLGRNGEARQALTHAEELDRKGELANKIHYNLGNIAVADNNREEAIREYRKALRADPADALARHNLEILLRNLPPKEQQGQDGGTPDGGKTDGGRPDAGPDGGVTDAGSDAGRPDAGEKDGGDDGGQDAGPGDAGSDGGADGGGSDAGDQGDGGRGDAGQGEQEKQGDGGQSEQAQPGDGGTDGGAEEKDGGMEDAQAGDMMDGGARMSKKDAEKLLDSFKSNEKNLQLWRFRQKTHKNDTKGKDW